MKILHLLYQSYPNISGSSSRSKSIINAQKNVDLFPVVLTSPFQEGVDVNEGYETIDDVKYYRCYKNDNRFSLGEKKNIFVRIKKFFTILSYFFVVLKVARKENVQIIHSHAMFYNAFPGILVSKILKIPHVYEIRSDWSQNSHFKSSSIIRKIMGFIENSAVKLSDSVVVISHGLYSKYSKINNNIEIIGNAVDDDLVVKNQQLACGFDNKKIRLGYIGSVIPLEGLEYVVDAFSRLKPSQFSLIIVGGGVSLEKLKNMAADFGLDEDVIKFTGKISPDIIPSLYEDIDVVINYRRSEPVAHSVTPLKPLEAMAYKKLVITSDVKGMTELVEHMATGLVVKSDDSSLLVEALNDLALNCHSYESLREAGFKYVQTDKSWNQNALKYKSLYACLQGKYQQVGECCDEKN